MLFDACRSLSDSQLDSRVAGVSGSVRELLVHIPKRFFLVHAIAHGVEHRTEVKVALAHLGVETPDLDGWPFAAAMGYGEEVGLTESKEG